MTTIRCTQKLLTELRAQPNLDVAPEESGWHANLLRIDRRKCVLFTHDPTLFSFVRCGLTRPDFAQFPEVFGQGLFATLNQSGFDQAAIERMLDQNSEVRYAKTNNRRVLGSMNDMKQILEWSIQSAGGLAHADLDDLTRMLNQTPFKLIDYDHPIDRLRRLLTAPATT